MKTTISQHDLAEAVARIKSASGKTLVRLSLSGGSLRLETATASMAVRTAEKANVQSAGTAVVAADIFCETVSHLRGEVTISCDGSRLVVEDEFGSTSLATVEPERLHLDRIEVGEKGTTVTAGALADAFRAVERAASRPQGPFPGVLFDDYDGMLRLVATDGFRLAVCDISRPALEEPTFLPIGELRSAIRILGRSGGERARIGLSGNRAVFSVGGTAVGVTTSTVRIPAYREILDGEALVTVAVNSAELLSAARRVAALAGDKSSLTLRGDPETGLTVSAPDGERGAAIATVVNATVSGGELSAQISPLGLTDPALSMPGEMQLGWSHPLKPLLVRKENVCWAVMPSRR